MMNLDDLLNLSAAEREAAQKHFSYFEKSTKHLIAVAKDRVGYELEMYELGVESTKTTAFDTIEEEQCEELFQILFSCYVAERCLGIKIPAHEYPFLAQAFADNLKIPDPLAPSPKLN